ncbi:hypothetical protein ACFFGH_06535 [Lysobacter korlensis]|uniref:DUF1364 family protein n=1 Tax=Lysobacter korlensis TaxID=553636 RepID=A0ABV6RL36_9GAMM
MNRHVRDRALLDCAYEFQCLLRLPGCEGGAGEPAHSNQPRHGKGGGLKAHDCFHVPACRSCHREFDQGKTMTRDEKRELWERAFWEYLPMLWQRELLKVTA